MIRSFTAGVALSFAITFTAVWPANGDPIISVGPFDSSTSPFVVPVDITDAVDLITWQFDLVFDPTIVQINVTCDPFTDAFCDLIFGPVTEGPFTKGPFSLFVPGVIDNVNGLLSLVAGGFGDPPPGPSGDGTLAYVEFVQLVAGDPNIHVVNAATTSSSVVPEPATLLLLTSGLAMVGAHRRRARVNPPADTGLSINCAKRRTT